MLDAMPMSKKHGSTTHSGQPYPHHNVSGQKQHLYGEARLSRWQDVDEPSRINCFDKRSGRGRNTYKQSLSRATVAYGLWSEDIEEKLGCIESDAGPAFDILTGQPNPVLTPTQREAVAQCCCTFWRRGGAWLAQQPRRLTPEVSTLIENIQSETGFSQEHKRVLIAEAAHLSEEPPARPFPLDLMVRTVVHMSWTVLCSQGRTFLTGDTPVLITPRNTIIARDTEVILPLSPVRVLVCDWGIHCYSLAIDVAPPRAVREVNRRIARSAVRRIYSSAPIDTAWIARLRSDHRRPRPLQSGRPIRVPARIRDAYVECVRRFPEVRAHENRCLISRILEHAEC